MEKLIYVLENKQVNRQAERFSAYYELLNENTSGKKAESEEN